MTVPPNHQKLIIPGKTRLPTSSGDYGTDMRTIEQWANEGIVRKLIAGSGITLTPSSGVDAGQGIEIASSGGGGSSTPGIIVLNAGSDTNDYPFTTIHLGPNDDFGSGSGQQGSECQLWSNGTANPQHYSFAKSWFTYVAPGDSVNYLPIVKTPGFTGSDLGIFLQMNAQSIDATEMDVENTAASALTQASSTSTRYPASDYANVTSTGTDISFVQGTGTSSGSGQLSTGGGTAGSLGGLYLCSVQLNVTVPAGVTFT